MHQPIICTECVDGFEYVRRILGQLKSCKKRQMRQRTNNAFYRIGS